MEEKLKTLLDTALIITNGNNCLIELETLQNHKNNLLNQLKDDGWQPIKQQNCYETLSRLTLTNTNQEPTLTCKARRDLQKLGLKRITEINLAP